MSFLTEYKINTLPIINPFHWGFNGTVEHHTSNSGTVKIKPRDDPENPIPFEDFVSRYVPSLAEGAKFRLNPLLFTGLLQTLYLSAGDFSKKFCVFYGREIVHFSDGGICTADWVKNSWKDRYRFNEKTKKFDYDVFRSDEAKTHPENWPRLHPRTRFLNEEELGEVHNDTRPLVVVIHGLAGGSHEPIIKSLTSQLSKIGEDRFQVVVLNSRGCARSKVTNRQLVTAFFTADIEEFLLREKARHPNRPIYGVGFSFGSTLLVNYLGRVGDKTPLSAAVVVCNPWDMVLSSEKMEKDYWSRTFFSKAITQFLTRMVKVNMAELETPEGTKPDRKPTVDNPNYFAFTRSNLEKAKKFTRVVEFDDMYTGPCLGFASGLDYYRAASSLNRLPKVTIPLLSINSKDDPVVGAESIPRLYLDESPNVLSIETDLGGHLAYLESSGDSWVTAAVAEFVYQFDKEVL